MISFKTNILKHLFFGGGGRRFHCRNKQKRFKGCLVNRKEAEFTIRMPGAKEHRIHETLEGNAGMTGRSLGSPLRAPPLKWLHVAVSRRSLLYWQASLPWVLFFRSLKLLLFQFLLSRLQLIEPWPFVGPLLPFQSLLSCGVSPFSLTLPITWISAVSISGLLMTQVLIDPGQS